jgi:cation diffusion facilitator CzcD-associated flavoprotein CzcO
VTPSDIRLSGRHFEVVIIGAGFAGIGFAINLMKAGFTDFVIVDEADGPGGTWHWNTYPGIAVDIPSFSYQFSFEQRPDWSRSYAKGAELKAYAENCVNKYGLMPYLRFGKTVTAAEWDDDANRWRVKLAGGDELTAQFLINACGVLTRPNMPDIPGVEDFAGLTMHSSRWDHRQDLRGKKVGIIGTGASAVQIIPAIADEVEHLTVFQRTPIWCLPKPDVKLASPIQWALKHFPGSKSAVRLVSQLFVEATFPVPAHYEGRLHVRKLAQRAALAYLKSQVKDSQTREKLSPRYGLGCKRPSFHNSYLSTFNRADVSLETTPISHITGEAVHTSGGAAHGVDVLILATGFKVMDPDNMPTYTLRGVDGVDLTDWWEGRRLQAYEGISVPGFPNHFTIFGPYGYNGSSYFALIEAQTAHILRVLRHARARAADYVEVKQEANDRFFEEMLSRQGNQIFWQSSCANANSYYFDKNGDVPLRPTTTLESAIRSRRFKLSDYTFRARASAAVGVDIREVASN